METLQFKNYRIFEDTGEISLTAINLLVGSNSSGKSSFLKFFPLLKQSMGVNRNGTFLWYSNDVDFKDFKNTVHDGKGNIEISTTINLSNKRTNRLRKGNIRFVNNESNTSSFSVRLTMVIAPKQENEDYLQEFRIQYYDQNIVVKINEKGDATITINDRDIKAKLNVIDFENTVRLLPSVYEMGENSYYSTEPTYASNYFMKVLNSSSDSLNELEDSSYMSNRKDTMTYLKMLGYTKDLLEANDIFIYMHLNDIIQDINYYFWGLSSKVTYVRPLRVVTERYYRYQNYAVNEIDSDGKNLAMYLANLSDRNMLKFTEWTSLLSR